MGFNAENNDNISEVKIICENIIKNKYIKPLAQFFLSNTDDKR